ncbi:FISUMP domain-containing protein [Fibrobacter sp.]|uniref:FISUMP domain-containing protein n=1 Tax=Fibrobacter sp. TaxID=35828 RepID=UPI003890CB15
MKKLLTLVVLLLCTAFFASCIFDDDEPKWNAAEVCPEIGTNIYGMPNRGTFIDERDGREYKYTTIGNQVWMAENLKYEAEYSGCVTGDFALNIYSSLVEDSCDTKECKINVFCEKYGRYYSLQEDGKYLSPRNQDLIDTICPRGWHVPSETEWNVLRDNMGADSHEAASRLKSADSLSYRPGYTPGSDDCLFSAKPSGGIGGMSGEEYVLLRSYYWTSTARTHNIMFVYYLGDDAKTDCPLLKVPIRCLKD